MGQEHQGNVAPEVRVPEGVAVLVAGLMLCGVGHAGLLAAAGESAPPANVIDGAVAAAAARTGLTRQGLEAAFPLVSTMPFDAPLGRQTTVHLFPPSVSLMPANIRPVWKGAMNIGTVTHLAFVTGEAESLLDISEHLLINGHPYPLEGVWRGRVEEACAALSEGHKPVVGVGLRLLDSGVAEGGRADVEKQFVLAGVVGLAELEETTAAELPGGFRALDAQAGASLRRYAVAAINGNRHLVAATGDGVKLR